MILFLLLFLMLHFLKFLLHLTFCCYLLEFGVFFFFISIIAIKSHIPLSVRMNFIKYDMFSLSKGLHTHTHTHHTHILGWIKEKYMYLFVLSFFIIRLNFILFCCLYHSPMLTRVHWLMKYYYLLLLLNTLGMVLEYSLERNSQLHFL